MDTRPVVIVKVGKTSNIKFRNVRAIRAITFDEIQEIVSNNSNVSAVIIESITPYEMQIALNTVDWINNLGKSVFIHVPNEANSQELRVSEEKGVEISTTLEELQHSISKQLAVRAYTAWGRADELQSLIDEQETEETTENAINVSNTSDSGLQDALSALNETKKTEVTHQSISTKEDLLASLGLDQIELNMGFSEDTDEETAISEQSDSLQDFKQQNYIELSKLLDGVTKEKETLAEQLDQAFDKIQTLLDIKAAAEDERDLYRGMLEGIESTTNIIEDPVPGAQLDKAKSQISQLQQSNISLEQRILEYKSESRVLSDKISGLMQDLSTATEKENIANQQIVDKQADIERLKNSLSASEATKIELANSRAEKQALEKTAVSLRAKIKELSEEIDSAMSKSSTDDLEKIQSLRIEIDNLNEALASSEQKEAIEARGRLVISMLLTEAIKQKSIATGALLEKNSEIAELGALEKKLRGSLRSSQEEIQQLEDKKAELISECKTQEEKFGIKIEEIQLKHSEELSELKVSLDTKTLEARRTNKELAEVRAALNKKETELTALMVSTGAKKKDVDEAISARKVLEETNTTLKSTVDMLQRDVRTLTSKLSMTEDANKQLEDANKQLRTSMITMKATSGAQVSQPGKPQQTGGMAVGKIRLDCEYSGRAYIIPVFGSGSFGITTMAVSIARRLPKASILYMDMDMVSPKSDAWFGKIPLIKELPDMVDPLKKSGFGALLEKGSSYVIDNKKIIMQRVTDTKVGSTIDYFSGVYTKVDPRKLLTVNFSELLNHFGNIYNYIVVDLGKFGSSDMTDELIKMFNRIAFRSVIVTLNNKFDTRTMSVRVSAEKIKLDNAIWALNMSDNSKVDILVQKSVGVAKPVVMPKDMTMYGSGLSFDRVPILKDRLSQVMDLLSE